MQIRKYPYMFVFIWKQYPENFGSLRVIPAKFNKGPELMFSNILQIFTI